MALDYDVIVVGAGHAGAEAALALSRLKLKTLVATVNQDRVSFMSCNPAIGGLAKGHIVREIEALGGGMGLAADEACIQFKRLNQKKGPAVQGRRMQCDKGLYAAAMREALLKAPGAALKETEIKGLKIKGRACLGAIAKDGSFISAKACILTTGTFMKAVMHVGRESEEGGRAGDRATEGISEQLKREGFLVQRLKTGTPPRLLKQSIDFSKTDIQRGDREFLPFSLLSASKPKLPQVFCYMTWTNPQTHALIEKSLPESPLFTGAIKGPGPRYCPSVEDKIIRFRDKERHQIFLEPEELQSGSIYAQGLSTSLPKAAQEAFLKTIPGLRQVKILRPGYAVEYDFVEPFEIRHTLETKKIRNLFLAGQINGSSGYEEAAGQGLMAGLNAGLKIKGRGEAILPRHKAYIGVLIDDLALKGAREPYRMFTSRAEHRLLLREDNVWERLFPKAMEWGLLTAPRRRRIEAVLNGRKRLKKALSRQATPKPEIQAFLKAAGSKPLTKPQTLSDILKRPELSLKDLSPLFPASERGFLSQADAETAQGAEAEAKYEDYIVREEELIKTLAKTEEAPIGRINYTEVKGLSLEEREKLSLVQPRTLGQARRISGVNPSAIQAIFIHLKMRSRQPRS